jgi:hypothetical protein
MSEIAAVLQDVATRFDAMEADVKAQLSKERILQVFEEALGANPEFARKFLFAGQRSDEGLVGSKYARWGLSVADIEWLYDVQRSLKGQRKAGDGSAYAGPSDELERTFGDLTDALYLPEEEVRKIDKRALDNLFPRIPRSALSLADRVILKRGGAWQDTALYARHARAMDTAESGFGQQLVGAQYVGDLWDAARRESTIFSLIDTFEMTDPIAYLPVEVDFPEMLFVGESTANNSSNYATSKTGSQRVAVTAYKFVIHQMWSGEMEEDSIIPFIPFLRRQAQMAVAFYSDSAVLNGDTTNAGTGNINLDDADPADTKHYLAFDGIRHAGLVDNTGNSSNHGGAAITLQALNAQRGRMVDTARYVDWGHPTDPNDLVYVSDVTTADQVALLDEFLTVDKAGANAGNLTGMRGRVLGHPFLASLAMSRTEADGKVSTTGGNNTLGQVVAFNRRGFKAGWRRRVRLESERLPATDQTRLVYSLRMGFARFSPTGAASGIEAADVIYNVL